MNGGRQPIPAVVRMRSRAPGCASARRGSADELARALAPEPPRIAAPRCAWPRVRVAVSFPLAAATTSYIHRAAAMFVPTSIAPRARAEARTAPALCMAMDRRAFLRVSGGGAAVAAVAAAGGASASLAPLPALALPREEAQRAADKPRIDDRGTMDKYVESLKYDEELYENPDAAAKEVYRTKKKEKEPEYREKERGILDKEEENLQRERQTEAREDAKLREEFAKKGK